MRLAAVRISTTRSTGPWHQFDPRTWGVGDAVQTACGLALPWAEVSYAQFGYDRSNDVACGDCTRGEALALVDLANQLRSYGPFSRGGVCRHGVYVGGCGIDWMCGSCETYSLDEEVAELRSAAADVLRRATLTHGGSHA